ncbi:MAG: hypothetical protein LUQ62_05315 [Methanomicrobiales archaeon]|nr:hypothetical protein [Methanomicrobiales archaeon]
MEHAMIRGSFLAVVAFSLLIAPVCASGTGIVIYSTDFSSDPGWVTNNPYTNRWDSDQGMFRYFLRDSTNTFIYKKIPYKGESFRLEYDLLPVQTQFQASFRLGLGDPDMYINQATTIFTEFENSVYGNLMMLRTVDPSNQRREVSSYFQSYGGPTVHFTDGTLYHVVITYDRKVQQAGIQVSFLGNHSTLWGYTLDSVRSLGPMDRIVISTIGDYTNPYSVAEGFLDNVTFQVYPEVVETTATPTTTPPVTIKTTVSPPRTTPPATAATPSPTAAPLSLLTGFIGLAGALLLFLLPVSRR